jgi:hypothetical protein
MKDLDLELNIFLCFSCMLSIDFQHGITEKVLKFSTLPVSTVCLWLPTRILHKTLITLSNTGLGMDLLLLLVDVVVMKVMMTLWNLIHVHRNL